MKRVRLSAQTELDLDDIWNYVANQSANIDVADKVLEAIGQRIRLLRHTPLAGRRRDDIQPGMRSFAAGMYVIYYQVTERQVFIARVIHGNREQTAAFSEDPN